MINNYNTIVSALNQFANYHLSLKRFRCSFFEQIDNFTTADNSFPVLYAVPNDSSFEDNIDVMSFRIYCLDILLKDRSNEDTILNETLLILRDLTIWLREGDNGLNILNIPRAIPVNNFGTEFTIGWYIDISIETEVETNDCSIPFSSNFILPGSTCVNTFVNQYLTCETLGDCDIITNIENQISDLQLSADTFIIGGSYSNGTLLLTRADGNVIPITGFTSNIVDVFVTGGTYNQNTGIATFTNNTGGTFTVNGFYTGGTAGVDVFVTGGTYNQNTGIATFVNNTGGTFTLSGLQDLYWSAGTGSDSIISINPTNPNIASGSQAIAYGGASVASGILSHAEGSATTATASASHSEGQRTLASGANSHAEGLLTTASASQAHSEGFGTKALGSNSHAEGLQTIASGINSHAEGLATSATSVSSHAEGFQTKAEGEYSHAEGLSTTAIGPNSHSEGNNTIAVGTSSHAEGTNNIANGENSFAGGVDSVANGNISFVFGSGSTANGNSTIVLGNNITGTSDNTVYVPNVQFDLNAPSTMDVGRMEWNDVDGTVELGLKGGVVKTEIGQGLVTRVVNKTVPNIDLLASNYQVVVVSGAQGQRLAVKLAQADNDANSAGTLGLIAENINKNQEGFIITVGLLKNINTTGNLQGETWNDGDILYLSPTTAGAITNIKPQAPQHTVIIGYVEYSHPNNGKIYVKIDNGYELNELHNVRISAATNDQVLSFNSTLNVWENRTLPNFITGFTDTFVTGGTYNNSTGTAIFTNNTGGTFNVSGFTTGSTGGLTCETLSGCTIIQNIQSDLATKASLIDVWAAALFFG